MKLSLFNQQAPELIARFNGVLNKLVNGDTKDIQFNSLRTDINKATEAVAAVSAKLNSVSIAQLKELRKNSTVGGAFGKAVENAASLSHLLAVLANMAKEFNDEEEVSLDDILGDEDEDKEDDKKDENCGSKNSDECDDKDEEDEKETNAGPDPIDTDEVDGSQDAKGDEAAVKEGDDITNLLNFVSVTKPKVSKTNSAQKTENNDGGLVSLDFLK